ncbi:MAG: type I-E CRISPR-associated protein Cas5/CasD [Xanthomonadaceae bacterium]|nr:type I-E CRISPR-associated protein Cas5/CasD [Xanthomonadaceae bacterium]MDP2184456.1 type I-E CRISPR-associated protein Cas5/CasD [Xanthomonadales bacterium]MDZ4114571.1 type I-E CRISPR-associated protein Cas5/CasD [Xanthomonadaceae bacterium]MDZ4377982.1 type I-E CRISPR-associated protein Cas5/CasD [Xanthomonadaceae bacterium]
MPRFLILRLDGPMQAWGTHTFEDFRPSNLYPTRSGLLGMLAACLGIERSDHAGQAALAASVEFSVRVDTAVERLGRKQPMKKPGVKLPDFHTVMDARKVDGKVNKFPVVSRREYLFDAAFTVSVGSKANALVALESIADALRRPLYTPSLGRRACPPSRPLLDGEVEAANGVEALLAASGSGQLIYSESLESGQPVRLRDVPLHGNNRQFGTRLVYLHKEPKCS